MASCRFSERDIFLKNLRRIARFSRFFVTPPRHNVGMTSGIAAAIEELEKENANLQPELLSAAHARELMAAYARAERLVSFGLAALSRKLEQAEVARLTGSSLGKARSVVATSTVMAASEDLSSALQDGEISLDQAVEIAAAEESAPARPESWSRSPRSSPSTC